MKTKSELNGNEYAFPQNIALDENGRLESSEIYGAGLTKREFIAMNILSGWRNIEPQYYERAVMDSVRLADALLKELSDE